MQPFEATLKNNKKGTLFFIDKDPEVHLPEPIRNQMMDLYNETIQAGQTYPSKTLVNNLNEFAEVWLKNACVVLVEGSVTELKDQVVLGTYYVKPNYVGRCSHNCNAGFLVTTKFRGQGIGKILGESYLRYAPTLGYTYSVFNLVFATNTASIKIWESLGFNRIGTVPKAAKLNGIDGFVDAYIYGKELI